MVTVWEEWKATQKDKKKDRFEEKGKKKLLEKLGDEGAEVEDLAKAAGISVMDLADWALGEDATGLVRGLVRLADFQTRLVLSRKRKKAAQRLMEVVEKGEKVGDVVRACAAALKAEVLPVEGLQTREVSRMSSEKEDSILAWFYRGLKRPGQEGEGVSDGQAGRDVAGGVGEEEGKASGF